MGWGRAARTKTSGGTPQFRLAVKVGCTPAESGAAPVGGRFAAPSRTERPVRGAAGSARGVAVCRVRLVGFNTGGRVPIHDCRGDTRERTLP